MGCGTSKTIIIPGDRTSNREEPAKITGAAYAIPTDNSSAITVAPSGSQVAPESSRGSDLRSSINPRPSDGLKEDIIIAEPKRRVSLKDHTRRGSEAYHTEGKVGDYYVIAGGKPIGTGGFGEVRLATRKTDGKT